MNIYINDKVLESIFLSCGTGEATQLVVLDSTLDQLDVLVKGVVPNTDIVLVKPQGNALDIISEALSSHAYQCLNIIAHGSPGCIQIGKHPIDSAQLHLHRDSIKQWSVEQINCYSCHLAQDPTFIAHLEQLTQASVAASEQPIGHKQQQGTWFISNSNGIAMKPPFTSLACDRFEGVLSLEPPVGDFGPPPPEPAPPPVDFVTHHQVTSEVDSMIHTLEEDIHTLEENSAQRQVTSETDSLAAWACQGYTRPSTTTIYQSRR